ncbi:MFS transporter [Dictyobacter vulcani]|uniref:MFS transporter n=1 Tax=Dictyobacter vulcani TaxID=2607529 RepID=A0A5J4KNI0_9CHLR|nr:MFS transporter [Dictyobacter vulcani]GER91258.1 MFS transporter [Dictyobacter vulcani]
MSLTHPDKDIAVPAHTMVPPKSLWKNTDFLKFWTGETTSLFGSQITLLALPLAAVLTLNANPEQLGLLRFLETAPYLLFPLIFGAWIERRRKRPLMILANAVRALLIVLVPLLALSHALQLPVLYLITFCVGIGTVLFDLCWLSFIPLIVSKEHLMEANSKVNSSSAAAEVAGPGLAGVLVQLLTAPLALLADSLSYIVSIVLLLLIRHQEVPPQQTEGTHLFRQIGEGLQFVGKNPYIRTLAIQAGAWNFFYAIVDIAFLLYMVRELNFAPGLIGLIYALAAIGGLLGSAIAGPLARRFPLGPTICATFTLGSAPFILLPLITGSKTLMVILFTIVFFLVRTALGIFAVQSTSLRQARTPPALMARMNATLRLLSYGGATLGPLVAGFLSTWIGLRTSLWIAGIGFILALFTLFASPVRHLQTFEP